MRSVARGVEAGLPDAPDAADSPEPELVNEPASRLTRSAPADARVRLAVERHLGLVWRVLRRAGVRPSDADDAAQDVFWVFAKRLNDVPLHAERAFLVSTALRVASNLRRSRWHRSVTESLELYPGAEGSSPAPLPDEVLELRRASLLLEQALERLAPSDRNVFVLAELEQMSRSEVAEALGIPEGTVASRLKRARTAFEAHVQQLGSRKGRLR